MAAAAAMFARHCDAPYRTIPTCRPRWHEIIRYFSKLIV
jgi:hypothetical protein